MAQARLYGFPLSHPMQMVRVMLELKGIDYQLVVVPTGLHPVAVRLFGFRGGTVPALKLPDGRRVQTTRKIARALDAVVPEPRLVGEGAQWLAEEEWADVVFQNIPRILVRQLAVSSSALRRWIGEAGHVPMAGAAARPSGPLARVLARQAGASDEHARAALAALPATMDRVDALLTDGVARTEPPDALALQLIATTKSLLLFEDLAAVFAGRPSTSLAQALDVPLPSHAPLTLPAAWLEAAGLGAR